MQALAAAKAAAHASAPCAPRQVRKRLEGVRAVAPPEQVLGSTQLRRRRVWARMHLLHHQMHRGRGPQILNAH